MAFPPEDIIPIVTRISDILKERKQTLSISESACGGLISSYIVSVPGASSCYLGSTLTYSLKSRLKLSGWSEEDIQSYTGPSEDVALRLARNLKYELGSTYTLSETGWAGPTGVDGASSEGVGTVYLAIVGPTGQPKKTHKDLRSFSSFNAHDRAGNMAEFAKLALEFLLDYLLEQETTSA
ncbi:uncharacterized protein SAPINGB_P000282 [Magnusiomyces paraingens]|uniref:CinA C-terminal domain-containing protein n=1 Tax=Magnusiomyces paraingens TaxID=2606893 RepID=A0A5E8B596_9ASCO|nr:uncharacterized protein SAPINGB_P000282 [Saprochaete ingens]VVT44060.1 unnamed protein product [Saprochaete ingens]